MRSPEQNCLSNISPPSLLLLSQLQLTALNGGSYTSTLTSVEVEMGTTFPVDIRAMYPHTST